MIQSNQVIMSVKLVCGEQSGKKIYFEYTIYLYTFNVLAPKINLKKVKIILKRNLKLSAKF